MRTKKTLFQITLPCILVAWLVLATLAHAADGTPAWTNFYNGPGNFDDHANSLTVDGSGNLYVTGQSYGSGSSYDYATIKYSSAGGALWTNRFNGAGNSDEYATALAVDNSGNVFVTGKSYGIEGSVDYATIKYSSSGIALWTNLFKGIGNTYDYSKSIAVDNGGNAYVTGYSGNMNTYDYVTIKYSSLGVPLWTNRYNGAGNNEDIAQSLVLDTNGNVYVTGTSYISGGDYDYATIKYSSAGLALWTNRFNRYNNDQARSLAVDSSGNVFVTGISYGIAGFNVDWATIKYSTTGTATWTNYFNGTGNDDDYANDLTVDRSGNVYVTGQTTATGNNVDCATIKYSNAGIPLWTNFYGHAASLGNARVIAVDVSGNVYVSASPGSSGTGYNYATIKYSSAGVALWTNLFNGAGNSDDLFPSLAVDAKGNVFVTGSSIGSAGIYQYATIKYSGPPPPVITLSGQLLKGGKVQLSFVGVAGANYALDRSFSLAPPNWLPQATNPANSFGMLVFTNMPDSNLNNFWRIRSVP